MIRVHSFSPFQDPANVVVGLEFPYDSALVELLKRVLEEARADPRVSVGGWLPERRRWFVELPAWPYVRARLLEVGHVLDGEPTVSDEGQAQTARQPEASARSELTGWQDVARRWYLDMAQQFHPQAGGTWELMGVVDEGARRLQGLIETLPGGCGLPLFKSNPEAHDASTD
jgi:hypothetical protein